ncbi:sulfotransferase [Marinobacteraceae bacterium S3BR75-40.1]
MGNKVQVSLEQALQHAEVCVEKGLFAEAKKTYVAILKKVPNNGRALQGLQVIEKKRGDLNSPALKKAVKHLTDMYRAAQYKEVVNEGERYLKSNPSAVVIYNIIGMAHKALRHYDEAISYFNVAIKHQPESAELFNNVALAYKEKGELSKSADYCSKSLALDPQYKKAHNTLGSILYQREHYHRAVACYRRALDIDPDYYEAKINLANSLVQLEEYEEAFTIFEELLSQNDQSADVYYYYGLGLVDKGEIEKGVEYLGRSVQIHANYYEALHQIGIIRQDMGDFDAATESFEKTIQYNPEFGPAYRILARMKKGRLTPSFIEEMERLYANPETSEYDRMHLAFALSEVEFAQGNAAEAMQYLAEGSASRIKQTDYSIEQEEDLFRAIKKSFSGKKYGDLPKYKNKSDISPVFIVGMPRSGTTLVEQILSSHSKVDGAGELTVMSNAMDKYGLPDSEEGAQTVFDSIRKYYLDALASYGEGPFITDKLPHNFRWLGIIINALPEARIIHVRRDPIATCWSNYKNFFPAVGMTYSFDLEDVARYYKLYEDLMAFWHELYPGKIYDLDYEALTENQESETKKMLQHLGLDWEDSVLEFHKNDRAVKTASNLQVRKKMYKGSSEAWREYEEWLQPMIKILEQ